MTWFSRLAFGALWLFVFTIPFEKAINVPGFGTLSKLAGFVAIGFGALALLIERRIRIPIGFHKAVALFGVWCWLTLNWSIARDVNTGVDFTYSRLITELQLFVMVLLIWQFTVTARQVHALMYAYLVGTLVPASDTIYNYVSGHMSLYYQRYALANTEPNDQALALALSLPMSYYLLLRGNTAARLFGVGHLVAACITILLTASRAGAAAMLLALTIVLWTSGYLTRALRAALAVTAPLLLAGTLAFVPPTSWQRLATSESAITEGTINSRTLIWKAGWENFERSPLVGLGAGAFPDGMVHLFGHTKGLDQFTPVAHNTFLSVLVETGVIGFSLFLTMLGVMVVYVSRMPSPARATWFTVLAVWTVGVMALTWEDRKPTWLVFSLIAAQHAAARETSRSTRRREPVKFRTRRPAWEENVSLCG